MRVKPCNQFETQCDSQGGHMARSEVLIFPITQLAREFTPTDTCSSDVQILKMGHLWQGEIIVFPKIFA